MASDQRRTGQPGTETNLDFRIEKRAGYDTLVWNDTGCRPATEPEVQLWQLLAAQRAPAAAPGIDLADEHKGMRVDYHGLLRQVQGGLAGEPGLAEMVRQLHNHMTELGRRWYAGDRRVVDELLQLYCIEPDARRALIDTSPKSACHPDDAAVDAFAAAMKAKLADARAKGRGGWNGDEPGMQQRLSDMLRAHVEKGDPRDVANFCMFLHQRGEAIGPKGAAPAIQVPAGWALVPDRMQLTPENMELLADTLRGADEDEPWCGGVLWVGQTTDDDGEPTYYGLNVGNVECLEEGSINIVEFDPPAGSPKGSSEATGELRIWGVQKPGSMPKLCGAREIAELNWYPNEGYDLICLQVVERVPARVEIDSIRAQAQSCAPEVKA